MRIHFIAVGKVCIIYLFNGLEKQLERQKSMNNIRKEKVLHFL